VEAPGSSPVCYLYIIDDFHAREKIRAPQEVKRETARGGSPLVPLTGLEPVRYCYRGILSFSVNSAIRGSSRQFTAVYALENDEISGIL
jgi:hypothetical protein